MASDLHVAYSADMLRISNVKLVWVLLSIVCLLLNPAGICAGNSGMQSPSHPCCPTHPKVDGGSACVCIDRPAATVAIPSVVEAPAAVHTPPFEVRMAANEVRDFVVVISPPSDIVVALHQILV